MLDRICYYLRISETVIGWYSCEDVGAGVMADAAARPRGAAPLTPGGVQL